MPLTDSYGQNVPYPTLTDKPNAQSLGQGIVEGIVPKTVMTFASDTVRGATITSPKPGMCTWLTDVQRLDVYDGTQWATVAAGTSSWKTLAMATGDFRHDGNNNGDAQYRIVNLFGHRTIMFRGGVWIDNYSSTYQAPNQGHFATLPSPDCPTKLRTITVACSIAGKSDRTSVKLDINTNTNKDKPGWLQLVGVNGEGNNPAWVSLNGTFCSL